jgi:hypothetical protein
MARVTYGALITELAGSIGGITFHKNSSGNIARLKPNMPMLPSQLQGNQQYKLSSLIAIWPTLTNVQKTSWNNLAAAHDHVNEFGEIKNLNGFQWFMSCNLNLLVVDAATILTAPAYAVPALINIDYVYTGGGNLIMRFPAGTFPNTNKILVYATSPQRQSTMKLRKSTFLLGSVTGYDDYQVNLKPYYEAAILIDWATLLSSGNCTVIFRAKVVSAASGLSSPFSSYLLKIG